MKNKYFAILVFITYAFFFEYSVCAASPKEIPTNLLSEFTLSGQIPVSYEYYDNTIVEQRFYTTDLYELNIQKALNREWGFFGETDSHLYRALDDMAELIKGKTVAVMGSQNAWYESILIAYGAIPIVIDFNSIQTNDSRVTYLTKEEYWKDPKKFDLVLSITNTAHDGLGRFGDSINPNGDLQSMDDLKKMIAPNGKLLLAVPVGPDRLFWNAYRVYGEIRLKLLLKGWRIVRYYGFTSEHIVYGVGYRPIFLLQSK